MNIRYDFDLLVIGGGSAGVRAARVASQLGAKVAITEEYRYGGTCVIRGCVPKKLMVYASHFSEIFEDAKGFGWNVGANSFSWESLVKAKDQEIARLSNIYEKNLNSANVTVLNGHASFIDEHTVEVSAADVSRVTAKYVLIATGGRPNLPKIPGIGRGITSNEVFNLSTQPTKIVIVGAGYIALEFAGIFNGLGTQVTVVHRGEEILNDGFDHGIREHIKEEMIAKGIKFILSSEISYIEKNDSQLLSIHFKELHSPLVDIDQLMFATGRVPNTENLGLQRVGVDITRNGSVLVDTFYKSTIDNIYAVGDVSSSVALTPVAIREGNAVAQTLFGNNATHVNLSQVPSAVFTQPPIGTVGLTEQQACQEFERVDIYETSFKPMKIALSSRTEKVFMKLVVEADTQKVLGVHMIGDDAPEIIQAIAIALKMEASKKDFDETIAIHPTVAEEFVTMKNPVRRIRR